MAVSSALAKNDGGSDIGQQQMATSLDIGMDMGQQQMANSLDIGLDMGQQQMGTSDQEFGMGQLELEVQDIPLENEDAFG